MKIRFGHRGNKSFTRPSRLLRGFLEEPTVEHRPSWRPDPAGGRTQPDQTQLEAGPPAGDQTQLETRQRDPAGGRTQLLARMNSWCVEAALDVHQLHVSTTDDVDVDGMKC